MDRAGGNEPNAGRFPRRKLRYWVAAAGLATAAIVVAGLAFVLIRAPDSGEPTLRAVGPIFLDGVEGEVIENLAVSNPDGDCIHIRNSRDIQLRNLKIGPCQGRGIYLEEAAGILIEGSTVETDFQPPSCCDWGSGILVDRSVDVTIDHNTLRRNETNIQVLSSERLNITNNRLEDPVGPFPRGQQIQLVPVERPVSDVTIFGNTMVCSGQDTCNQEDAINVHGAVSTTIQNNLIIGGNSPSGCGILLENNAADIHVSNNYLYDTGNCGIGVAGGEHHVVENNQVLLTREVTGGGNVAIYVWLVAGSCGEVLIRNNLASFVRQDGSHHGFWNGGGCSVTVENNRFGAAAMMDLEASRASMLMERLVR